MMQKKEENDLRNVVRMDFSTDIVLSDPASNRVCSGKSSNISLNGMHVDCIGNLPVGTPCMVQIVFPGQNSRLLIDQLAATVVRTSKDSVSIAFAEPLEWYVLFHVYQNKMQGNS